MKLTKHPGMSSSTSGFWACLMPACLEGRGGDVFMKGIHCLELMSCLALHPQRSSAGFRWGEHAGWSKRVTLFSWETFVRWALWTAALSSQQHTDSLTYTCDTRPKYIRRLEKKQKNKCGQKKKERCSEKSALNWRSFNSPPLAEWKQRLKPGHMMERTTAALQMKMELFRRRWLKMIWVVKIFGVLDRSHTCGPWHQVSYMCVCICLYFLKTCV